MPLKRGIKRRAHGHDAVAGKRRVAPRQPAGQFGQIGMAWEVPAEPLLYGAQVFAQVLLLDPDVLPDLSIEATNGLELTIGF